MHDVRVCSDFIDLHVVSNFPLPFAEDTSFLHCIFFPLSISVWVYSLIHIFDFVQILHYFDYSCFVISFDGWGDYASCFVLFLRIAVTSMCLLWFHINFRIICSSSLENVIGT